MASNFAKLDKFEGVDFKRCQKKMYFLLSSMSVLYVMTTPIPEDGGDDATVEQIRKRAKWTMMTMSAEAKYMAEDASTKKFLARNFTNYKMTDSRPVLEQYNELLGILKRFTQHKITWMGPFRMTIEESLRVQDSDKPKGNNVVGPSVVNMMEHNNSSMYNDNKGKRKHHDNTRVDPNKKAKLTCWTCGKLVTLKRIAKVYYVTYVSEAYFVQDDDVAWAVVRLPDPKLKTLGERGIECIFVRYDEHSKAFRFNVIEPNDSVSINSIIESRDSIFDENRFSSVPRPSLGISNGTKDIDGLVVPKEVTEEVDGTIEKFKARLVIQGFEQKSRIDYFDTYALVAHISTIRLLIDMASIHNLIIHQMDVKTTFLNGVIICLYVDDMLIFGTDQAQVDLTKEFLSSRFSMKGMGEADVILVLEGYTYASWINNSEDNSSTSGWVFLLGGVAGKEAEWLRNLILEIL
nr:hypothetical protein [Tanacetum cinerariifolium]